MTVNLREKFFEHFVPSLNVDAYLDATKPEAAPHLMENILSKIVGLSFKCKAFIYQGDNKTSITIHPPNAARK